MVPRPLVPSGEQTFYNLHLIQVVHSGNASPTLWVLVIITVFHFKVPGAV